MADLNIQRTGLQNTIPNQVGDTTAQQTTGSGAVGNSGPVPDAAAPNGTGGHEFVASYAAILGSIMELVPEMNHEDQEVKLLEITVKLRELEDTQGKEKIKVDTAKKQTALQEKQDKLDEAQKKIDEAEEKQRNMSIWDKIKCAFQWLGAIISIALGAILIATGVGAVAGGLLIAAGVAGIIMAIDATVKLSNPNGLGIAGCCAAHNAGVNPWEPMSSDQIESCQKADMIFGYVMVAISIALAIASLGAAFGPAIANAVTGGASAATATASAVETAAQVGETAATIANVTAKTVSNVMTAVNDIMTISTAIGDVTVGAIKYETTQSMAEGTKMKGEAKQMEALLQMLDDIIDQTMSRMKASTERFDQMIDGIIDSIKDRGDSLSQAKFKA